MQIRLLKSKVSGIHKYVINLQIIYTKYNF